MIYKFFETVLDEKIKLYWGYVVLDKDVVVIITGGKEHIGAVGISIPRPSLKDPNKISSSTSVFTRISHKEDEVVKRVGDKISSKTNRFTTVIAGIHFDNLSEKEIKEIVSKCDEIADYIIEELDKL